MASTQGSAQDGPGLGSGPGMEQGQGKGQEPEPGSVQAQHILTNWPWVAGTCPCYASITTLSYENAFSCIL